MYPKIFQPTDIEPFVVNGQTIHIPKCFVRFDKWTGESIQNTFGGKPLVSIDNKPMFAELAIMTHFYKDNWEVRWVETYGRKEPIHLTNWLDDKYTNQIHVPFVDNNINKMLSSIAKTNSNSYSGCWDVVAKKGERVLFIESKRTKKDNVRLTQINWLSAGLKNGFQADNFLVVQWDF